MWLISYYVAYYVCFDRWSLVNDVSMYWLSCISFASFASSCLTMAKKKSEQLVCQCFTSKQWENIAKSITILKICKRSFKWDLAGCSSSIRLEMALEWRPVVKNLEIQYYLIFMGYLCCNIEIKQIELEICSWCHYKENSKLYNLLIDIE